MKKQTKASKRIKLVELEGINTDLIRRLFGKNATDQDYEDFDRTGSLHLRAALRAIFATEKSIPKNFKIYVSVELEK